MRFAYADPPYLGCGKLYPGHPDAHIFDNPETHRELVERLCRDYPDGWAMSLSSPSLRVILPMCPDDVRVCAWVKPFAAFKRNVRIAYTWEPVIIRGGRKSSKDGAPVGRDHLAESITLRRGLTGAKPARFNRWVLDLLGYIDGQDTLDDIFPWHRRHGGCSGYSHARSCAVTQPRTSLDSPKRIEMAITDAQHDAELALSTFPRAVRIRRVAQQVLRAAEVDRQQLERCRSERHDHCSQLLGLAARYGVAP